MFINTDIDQNRETCVEDVVTKTISRGDNNNNRVDDSLQLHEGLGTT